MTGGLEMFSTNTAWTLTLPYRKPPDMTYLLNANCSWRSKSDGSSSNHASMS